MSKKVQSLYPAEVILFSVLREYGTPKTYIKKLRLSADSDKALTALYFILKLLIFRHRKDEVVKKQIALLPFQNLATLYLKIFSIRLGGLETSLTYAQKM